MPDANPQSQQTTGMATDATGTPVIDPSKNVLDLVDAAIKRQDDLREAESRHTREVADLRAEHTRQMREAEAERLNAIREVDRAAVQEAANVLASQAATLAATVATSAEAMRAQVAAAASAQETSQATALAPITAAIESLRQSQYEAVGQATEVVDRRAGSSNTGLWIGIAVSVFVAFLGVASFAVSIGLYLSSQ